MPLTAEPLPGPNDSSGDEARLIDETLEGNAAAFDELIRAHHGRVYRFLCRMTRQHHDAEDLVQQTFIKAYQHLAQFDQSRPFINWVLTIARNNARNHYRDTVKWEEMAVEPAATGPSPAQRAEKTEESENLWARARALLSQREYEILWFRFGEDLTTRETAKIVQLTETHVKVLLFRARQTLLKGAIQR